MRINGAVVAYIYIIVRGIPLPSDERVAHLQVGGCRKMGIVFVFHSRYERKEGIEPLLEVVDALVVFQ